MNRRGITGLEVLGVIFLISLSLKLAVLATGKRQKCEYVEKPAQTEQVKHDKEVKG